MTSPGACLRAYSLAHLCSVRSCSLIRGSGGHVGNDHTCRESRLGRVLAEG